MAKPKAPLEKKLRQWLFIAGIVILALFLLRGIGMDKDCPPFGIGIYDTVDEGIYGQMAINYYHTGGLHKGDFPIEGCGYTEPLMQTIVLNNLLLYASMCLLGNNYYALRFPPFLQGTFILLLLLFFLSSAILKATPFQRKRQLFCSAAVVGFLLLDFPFLLATVTFESSLLRGVFILLVWLIFFREWKSAFWQYFCAALVSVISVFFVYLTNVFLAPVGVIMIAYCFWKRGKQKGLHALTGYCLGGILGMIPAELYYILVWQSGAIQKALSVMLAFSRTPDHSISIMGSFLHEAARNLRHLLGTQIFFYSPVLAVLFLATLFYLLIVGIQGDRPEAIFTLACVAFYTVQTLLSSDYAERKAIMLYPILLFSLFLFLSDREAVKSWCAKNQRFCAFFLLFGAIFSSVCYVSGYLLRNDLNTYRNSFENPLWMPLVRILFVVAALLTALQLVCALYLFLPQGKRSRLQKLLPLGIKGVLVIALCAFVAVNGYMSLRFYYIFDSYTDQDVCAMVERTVGNDYLLGAYGLVYTFYNDAKSVYGPIELNVKLTDLDEIQYYFDYGHVNYRQYMNQYLPSKKYLWRKKTEVQRNYVTSFGLVLPTEAIYTKTPLFRCS